LAALETSRVLQRVAGPPITGDRLMSRQENTNKVGESLTVPSRVRSIQELAESGMSDAVVSTEGKHCAGIGQGKSARSEKSGCRQRNQAAPASAERAAGLGS